MEDDFHHGVSFRFQPLIMVFHREQCIPCEEGAEPVIRCAQTLLQKQCLLSSAVGHVFVDTLCSTKLACFSTETFFW